MPYPRSSSFAWSNRGQLVTFAFHKYDFNKMEKTEQKSGTKSKDKNQRNLNPRGILATGFDFGQFFQQRHYFKRNQEGGSVLDGARTIFHENGTVIDGFDQTIQSQSLFFRDDALGLKHENATIRTIGEETSNQLTNQLAGDQSGYGMMISNRLKDQENHEHINHRVRHATKAFGSGLLNSDMYDNPRQNSFNNNIALESPPPHPKPLRHNHNNQVSGYDAADNYFLQMLPGEPSSKDKREYQQPGGLSRKVSYTEDVYNEMIPEENNSHQYNSEFTLNVVRIGSDSKEHRKERSRKRELENGNVDNQKMDTDWKLKHPIQMTRKSGISGSLMTQQPKVFRQPERREISLQSQNKKSNVYVLDFSKAQKLNFEMTQKLDLLNKADLKQQIQKLLCDKVTNNEDIWKLINTTFGNLSKNTLFSDTNRSSQTNLIFWRQKIQVWKNHPLGLGMIYRLLEDFQRNQDFVQFCILAATLFEYELRIYKYISQYSRHQAENQHEMHGSHLPQIVLKNKRKQLMLKNKLSYNVSALPTMSSSLNINEVGLLQSGIDSTSRMQFLAGSSRHSSRTRSRKSQYSTNSRGGHMSQRPFKSFGNHNDNYDENQTVLSLTHEHEDDRKSHKSNISHRSPQSHQSPNEHPASYPQSPFNDSNDHDDSGPAKPVHEATNFDRQSERYREEQRSNGGQSQEAKYHSRDALKKNQALPSHSHSSMISGVNSPDFNAAIGHSNAAGPATVPGSGGSDLSSQSLRGKQEQGRGEFTPSNATKQSNQIGDWKGARGAERAHTVRAGQDDKNLMLAKLEVCEADQEANISKRFLAVGDSSAGAADQRHRQPHPVPANQSKLHFTKHPQPADQAFNNNRNQRSAIQHQKADLNYQSQKLNQRLAESASLAPELVLMKTGTSNSQHQMIPSLIIKEKPQQSLALLMYLKKFSEMLVAWGQSSKAIQISKIISRSYALYEQMNIPEPTHSLPMTSSQNQQQLQSASGRSAQQHLPHASHQSSSASVYPQSSRTISPTPTPPFNLSLEESEPPNVLKTHLLFSEQSLLQGDHQNAYVGSILVPCQDCTDKANMRASFTNDHATMLPLQCEICNLTVRGLAYQCIECGHGGHRAHIEKWIQQQQSIRPPAGDQRAMMLRAGAKAPAADSLEGADWSDPREPQAIKCPCGWCECTLCFRNFKLE